MQRAPSWRADPASPVRSPLTESPEKSLQRFFGYGLARFQRESRHARKNNGDKRLSTPRLELAHLTKRYPAVVANDGVSLVVQPGETHAVLGENGAGKSTLMKIIYGAVKPDEGAIRFNGQPVVVRNPHEARALGISMVFQHFSL